MKKENTKLNGGEYVLGAIIAIPSAIFLSSFLTQNSSMIVKGTKVTALIIIIFIIYKLIISRRLLTFFLGCISGVLALLLFMALFAIELTIHPPSEE
jgi:hypothetical protein